MSKTFFNMSEKKQKIINFIKKHKNMLGVVVSGMTITDEYLSKLKNASNEEFFGLVNKVRLKSCPNFFIFYHDEKHHMSEIWLPDVLSKNASDKAIKEFCGSNSFEDVIEIHSSWYNMTPKRWETFEAVFDLYDKQKTPAKKTVKKTVKKTAKKTAKIFFNSSEKKQNVINFIKKHKNILGVTEKVKDITDEYFSKLEKANNEEFLRLVHKVKLKFGQNFFIFSDNCDEKHPTITIWLPVVLSKLTSDKAIKEFCGINSFTDVIEKGYCYWYSMTPKRWKTFEAIFDFYNKQKKTAKKIVKQKEVKLSDSALLKDDIVFIDFEADEFDHLMNQGGSNIAVYIDNKSKCNAKNQIDHLINAFKLAKKEAESFVELLETAKKNGAKHVVDSSYIDPTVFNFTK